MCQNSFEGHILFPENREDKLVFSYTPCRYEKKAVEAMENKQTSDKELQNARMKDIDITDKNRIKLIKFSYYILILTLYIKNKKKVLNIM